MGGIVKVYIAHNFEARKWLRDHFVPTWLRKYEITSNWILDGVHSDGSDRKLSAKTDVDDVIKADCLVLFVDSFQSKTGRGKWFEFGLAYALGKPVILVGEDLDSCVFNYLDGVYKTCDYEGLRDTLKLVEKKLKTRNTIGQPNG